MDHQTDWPTDGWTDVWTHALIESPRCNLPVKETIAIEYFCRCFSTGSNSQSECEDFSYGPITAEIGLATSEGIENLPLKVTNHEPVVYDGKFSCADPGRYN